MLNTEATGWFCWNMATWDLREHVATSAMALPYEDSEWDRMDLETVEADNHPIPMVAASPVKFECRYLSTHRLIGDSNVGTVDVVFEMLVPGSDAAARAGLEGSA